MLTFWRDVVHGSRVLRQNPGFSAVAMLSIAIGVGANAAMFSIADGLILRPLPVPHARKLVVVNATTPAGETGSGLSYRDYVDLRDGTRTFAGLIAADGVVASFGSRRGEPTTARFGLAVSGNLFQVLGIAPALGRPFRPDEDLVPGRDAVIVLAHETWTEQFGEDPGIIGRTVRVGGEDFTVIGVGPEGFTGLDIYVPPAFYVPIAMLPSLEGDALVLERRDARRFDVLGRLGPGVSVAQADQEVRLIAATLAGTHPDTNRRFGMIARPEMEVRREDFAPAAGLGVVLMALAVVVLLVACANVTGLLASRAPVRAREIAVRLAIGGGRLRLFRQLFTESLLLATGGALLGIAIGYGGIASFRQFQIASDIGVRLTYGMDQRALLVAVAVAAVSAVLSGVVPAWRATFVPDVATMLRSAANRGSRPQPMWARHGLIAAQIGLALVVLTVALAFRTAFEVAYALGPGFRTERMLLVNLDPALVHRDQQQTDAFYRQLKERVAAMPGVTSVGLTSFVPLSLEISDSAVIAPEGVTLPDGTDSVRVRAARVDETLFDAIGIPIVAGRAFTADDDADAPRVAIVNRGLAERYWPDTIALGKRLRLDTPSRDWVEIVGVVEDAKYVLFTQASADFVYLPRAQQFIGRSTLVVASTRESLSLAGPVQAAVLALDADMPVRSVRTIEDYYRASAKNLNVVVVRTIAGMGAMGLALAMIGLYGLVAFAVSSRTREIGIRMALGATPSTVVRMTLRQGWQPTIVGALGGVAASVAAERLVAAVLPGTFGQSQLHLLVIPLLAALVMVAAYLPARRAARIDPLVALRQD